MKSFFKVLFVIAAAAVAVYGLGSESKEGLNHRLPPAPDMPVTESGILSYSGSAAEEPVTVPEETVPEEEETVSEEEETVPEEEDGESGGSAFTEEDSSGVIEEIAALPDDNSSIFDSDRDYRDFVTKKDFDEAVSRLAWKKGPFTITPYGFLWANAAWNSSRCVNDGFCLYSISDEVDDTAGTAVEARMSRIGAMIDGPGFPNSNIWKMKGVLEADFEGTVNGTRNRGQLMLRKAFVELRNEERDLRLAFGQDWDLMSPLAPQMLNYLPAGFCGNIGYRRCQFRVDKGIRLNSDCRTLWQIALVDPFAADFTSASCVAAESGGWPIVEARAAVTVGERSCYAGPATFGVSGHIGEETYRFSPVTGTYRTDSETDHIKTWSVNFDGDLPLTKRLSLQGEYYYGRTLNSFCGGIMQGVDLYYREGIRDQGGWMSLHTKLTEKLTNNTGYGIDKPLNDDLAGTTVAANGKSTFRTKNQVIFTNFLYQWNKALMTGIELGYWETDWMKSDVSTQNVQFSDMESGKTFRIDCAVQYLF